MKNAEAVTFGGSSLERAAQFRGDADELAKLRSDPNAQTIVFWRGKPLLRRGDWDALARLPMTHPLLASRAMQSVRVRFILGMIAISSAQSAALKA